MIYFIGEMEKIVCIEFEITNIVNEIFYVDKLIETNKKNGYAFDFPVIILEPTFFKTNSAAINMSRIDEVKIRVCHEGLTELLIYNVNINTLKTANGYNSLGFIH
jgi:hypothetical protein